MRNSIKNNEFGTLWEGSKPMMWQGILGKGNLPQKPY
jgi:hypothetical protein